MKKKVKAKPNRKEPLGKGRLIARIVSITLVLAVVACCAVGDWFVHHPRAWLESHRAFYTAPLWYFGNRTAFITDAFGWTGHDAVYDFDETVPSNEVFFAGAPERVGDPAPNDIVVLDRGTFKIGWSPSLRHPVWAAYHVVKDARFDALQRPNFQQDRSVASSPAANDYARSGYDRGHLSPAADFAFDEKAMSETFYMSNMSPQKGGLNRGIWKDLEAEVRLWAKNFGRVYVVSGPILEKPAEEYQSIGENGVSVPEFYYKVILS